MNHKFLVKISNRIGLFSILLLVYWVFTFILVTVFGLKIFRENLTETFTLSILGILALMGGALMLNIMLNLTRIAEREQITPETTQKTKRTLFSLIAIFPLIAALAFTGDYLSEQKKERFLLQSAQQLLDQHPNILQQIANYQFTAQYIHRTANQLDFLAQLDTSFTDIAVLAPDQIEQADVYLTFDSYGFRDAQRQENLAQPIEAATAENHAAAIAVEAALAASSATDIDLSHLKPNKINYIKKLTLNEREYLAHTFKTNSQEVRLSANDGRYELFYPYQINGKTTVVLYFSDYQRYGKFGS